MCLFPKWYEYNRREPVIYPFPRRQDTNDYSIFNAAYFQHLDNQIMALRQIGVEADLILFHPYDKWGYASMPPAVDDRYLRYVIARFAAYRNVWWSLANEYDDLKRKTMTDWDRFARIISEEDPYGHMRSIHYDKQPYDYNRRWCTHAGVQSYQLEEAPTWRADWNKPLIFDECQYEGNIASRWGNLPGDELTRRFWLAIVGGAYCGHGETYIAKDDVLWWSHGGTLHGTSPKQIAFLSNLLQETIAMGEGPIGFNYDPSGTLAGASRANKRVLFFYFDLHQPSEIEVPLPDGFTYRAEYIDALKMTRTPLPGAFQKTASLQLPGTPYGSLWFFSIGNA
jgi:hypothetical protein